MGDGLPSNPSRLSAVGKRGQTRPTPKGFPAGRERGREAEDARGGAVALHKSKPTRPFLDASPFSNPAPKEVANREIVVVVVVVDCFHCQDRPSDARGLWPKIEFAHSHQPRTRLRPGRQVSALRSHCALAIDQGGRTFTRQKLL
jgi:hypothetical protein